METEPDAPSNILFPALLISIVLLGIVYIAFQAAKARPDRIILPGGITYLGPSVTPTPAANSSTGNLDAILIPSNPTWATYKGKLFPYTFTYPSTLSLGWFPNDPYDAVTVFYGKTDANKNVFFRVDDLTKLHKTAYTGNVKGYAQSWWKDYSWKGISSITPFTNGKGLKGYRATYIDQSDKTPYDHVFFETPQRRDLIIWISGKIFPREMFDKIVDSVQWSD